MDKLHLLKKGNIEDFTKYNEQYDKGAFAGSEATKYNIDVIKKWIDIREEFSFTEEFSKHSSDFENWKEIDIVDGFHTKYEIGYIYVNETEGTWRIKKTSDEFYGKHHEPFDFDAFERSINKEESENTPTNAYKPQIAHKIVKVG